MNEPAGHGLPTVQSQGRLEGISVPDLLWSICREKRTGVLSLTHGAVTKAVYFRNGEMVFSASNDPNDRLGEMLLRDGVITLDQLQDSVEKLNTGKRLGTLLVEAGHLTPDNLVRGVLGQVQRVILSLFSLEEGVYQFEEGPLPSEEVIQLFMRSSEILMQGIRQIRSFTRIRRSVGSPRTRYGLVANWERELEDLAGNSERMIIERLRSGDKTVEQLCRDLLLSNFEIYQTLWCLKVLGVVQERDHGCPAMGMASLEGRVGSDGIAPVLVQLARAGETGVLHLSRCSIDRTFHIREGRLAFATSSSIDDGLVAHLLRRGIISLRDREETTRRLLSNKRVGTILLEMGVLNARELRDLVKEQIGEIIFDTFRWDTGEYAFVAGELPTLEEITLDLSLEDIVAEGIRRVIAWSRVRRGCGELDSRLALAPSYLEVLDRMQVGPDVWQVVAALRQPRTVHEVCRGSALGDFRVCQVLWTLKVLGAAEEQPWDVQEATTPAETDRAVAEAAAEMGTDEIPASQAEVIEVAELAPETGFEVTDVQETLPAMEAGAEPAVAPSEWQEPRDGEGRHPGRWETQAQEAAIPLSDAGGAPSEVVAELWRLAERSSIEGDVPPLDVLAGSAMPVLPELPPGDRMEPAERAHPPALEVELADSALVDRPVVPEPASEFLPVECPPREPDTSVAEERDSTTSTAETAFAENPDETAWELPAGLDEAIHVFNSRHRTLYRAIRAEVGAGAANFVRSCRNGMDNGRGELFAGEMRPDGTWDEPMLRSATVRYRIPDPAAAFDELIENELEKLRIHIGDTRTQSLREQLDRVDR